MNIGIFFIGIGRYVEMYDTFKESIERFFLPQHKKKYFIITDKEDFECGENEEKVIVEDEGWVLININKFKYFLNFDFSDMDYVFFLNGNTICQREVFEKDVIPTEEENYLCCLWHYSHNCLPFDTNKESSCYMIGERSINAYRGAFFGGRSNEFLELCQHCVEMVEKNGNYYPKYVDEAYFNKHIENKKIKKIDNKIYSYIKACFPKMYTRDKNKILGISYIKNKKELVKQKLLK